MATITEDFVSLETAKLLKEKGFECVCKVWYSEYTSQFGGKKYTNIEFDSHNQFNENYKFICYAPTLQMAMKWLRESHNLYIEPYVIKNYNNNKLEYTYSIQDLDFNGSDDGIECCNNWNSPEEACEAAIKYCLENLI